MNAEVDGPRSGDLLHPGEVFRVSEEHPDPAGSGAILLRLADGRGWLFDRKPGVGTMCSPLELERPVAADYPLLSAGTLAPDVVPYGSPLRAPPLNTIPCGIGRGPGPWGRSADPWWRPGSVLEVFSVSLGTWSPALVTQVSPNGNLLTLRFVDETGAVLTKILPPSDPQLCPFGRHITWLPPYFEEVRWPPGHHVPEGARFDSGAWLGDSCSYRDVLTGLQCTTVAECWGMFIDRHFV